MRQSTRKKLFPDDVRVMRTWETTAHGADVSVIVVKGKTFMLFEYPDERDGFQVYEAIRGNSVDAIRERMNLPPIYTTGKEETKS